MGWFGNLFSKVKDAVGKVGDFGKDLVGKVQAGMGIAKDLVGKATSIPIVGDVIKGAWAANPYAKQMENTWDTVGNITDKAGEVSNQLSSWAGRNSQNTGEPPMKMQRAVMPDSQQ